MAFLVEPQGAQREAHPEETPGQETQPVFVRPWGTLRSTFKVLSDWGDDFERKHFDGDFLNAVSSAPRKVVGGANRISEELGSAAAKLIEEAAGKAPDPLLANCVSANSCGDLPLEMSSSSRGPDLSPHPAASLTPSSNANPLQEAQQLQEEISHERNMRQGRVVAFAALDEGIRGLRAELVEERGFLKQIEDSRLVALEQLDQAERALENLQEEHHALLSRKTTQVTDLRRHTVAAAMAENADKQLSRAGGWARTGPETEALKDAKVALAEILAELDEVRLQSRREAAQLQKEIETTQAESMQLQQRTMDNYVAPKSFRASVRRLFKIAGGGDDACTDCETQQTPA